MNELERYKKFLEFLAKQKKPITYEKVISELKLNKDSFEQLMRHMYEYFETIGHVKGKESDWGHHLMEITHKGVEYLRNLQLQRIAEDQTKSNKTVAIATVAIALGSLAQAIVLFKQFSNNVDRWTDFVALILLLVLVVLISGLAWSSFALLKR
ncbi:hypothetical protein COV18_03130 [Candidatus Woesearchaeota archaeon CG10_big_fil_rev_8_21_14_0_10_37_12]|nr:MAG: hypothetical protein COV18_03130 [Candidatus Woesearchaeota archaeon CG10_big_fil_rev_8_21_14_0_10_37_12]